MAKDWEAGLTRWTGAGLIDETTAARIRAFEQEHTRSSGLRWPVWLAVAFGALMTGAGVLLFVAANWDSLSPASRFSLVVALVAAFHVGGTAFADRFPPLSAALHAIGTLTLGAGVFLAGQIFNLEEHWPGGFMLWALGAAIAWGLLRHWTQLALVALLAPAWLIGEWTVAVEGVVSGPANFVVGRVVASGVFLLALAYFTAARGDRSAPELRVLQWVGAVALLPAALALAVVTATNGRSLLGGAASLPSGLRVMGWSIALAVPLVVSAAARKAAAWPTLVAVAWVLALLQLRLLGTLPLYAWWAIGAMLLAAWGVAEARSERINMGSAIFAATIVAFYFSEVMDKLGRSASLVGFGLLFLAGGWALDRLRRRLIRQIQGGLV
jgi:hypothetical protein